MLSHLPKHDPRLLVGPQIGEDAAVIDASGRLIAAGADVVVVAGAAVAGVAHRLRAHVSVPLPDGIACAVGQAETLVRLELRQRVAVPPLSQLLLR